VSVRSAKVTDESLLKLLACGATVESAARKLGVTERTVYRRLTKPGFKERLRALRNDIAERNANTASALATEALKTLLDLMSPGQPPTVRLRACDTLLRSGIKLQEHADLTKRVTALEQEGTGAQPTPGWRGSGDALT
jgi:site-specific recombinase XerD